MQPTWVNQYPTPSEAAKNSLKPTQRRSALQQQFPPQVAGVGAPVYNGQQNGESLNAILIEENADSFNFRIFHSTLPRVQA